MGVMRGEGKKAGSSDLGTDETASWSQQDSPSNGDSAVHLTNSGNASHSKADYLGDDLGMNLDASTGHLDRSRSTSPTHSSLRLLKSDSPEQGLWRQAWNEVMDDLSKVLPPDFDPLLDTHNQVRKVKEVGLSLQP